MAANPAYEFLDKTPPGELISDWPGTFERFASQHAPLQDYEWLVLVMTLGDLISKRPQEEGSADMPAPPLHPPLDMAGQKKETEMATGTLVSTGWLNLDSINLRNRYTCPCCGAAISKLTPYCGDCGAKLPEDLPRASFACKACGAEPEPGRLCPPAFCTNCGERVSSS